jgi:hypothetical protein
VARAGAVYSAFAGEGKLQSKGLQISDLKFQEIISAAFPLRPV